MNLPKCPNFLWLSLEDTSPWFGCCGDPVARTPNLDEFAEQGCRYTHAFSTAGVCSPSRYAVITGSYATWGGAHHHRTGHRYGGVPGIPRRYEAVPPPEVKCFSEYLRAAGYFCTNNEKTDYQFKSPLTAWDEIGDEAHWRHRWSGEQPFFAVFNPLHTHESGMWPEKRDGELITDPDSVEVPPYLPDTRKTRESIAQWYDKLERSDRIVGRLLSELEEDGLAGNTVVFVWSDHGVGLPRGKRWPYDSGIRVPLIVRWPGVLEAGSVSDSLVSMIDLAPTVLSLAGISSAPHMQGVPFLGADAGCRDYVYATRDRHDAFYDKVRAVRDRRFKYIRHYEPQLPYFVWDSYGNRHPAMQEIWRLHAEEKLAPATRRFFEARPVEELYDTEADPHEMDNLAGKPEVAEKLDELRSALDRWIKRYDRWQGVSEEKMVFQMYGGAEQPKTAPPLVIVLGAEEHGVEPTPGDVTVKDPVVVQLHCGTQGASIAYTLDEGEQPRWRLYAGPFRLPGDGAIIRAKAIRLGYQESDETLRRVTVR